MRAVRVSLWYSSYSYVQCEQSAHTTNPPIAYAHTMSCVRCESRQTQKPVHKTPTAILLHHRSAPDYRHHRHHNAALERYGVPKPNRLRRTQVYDGGFCCALACWLLLLLSLKLLLLLLAWVTMSLCHIWDESKTTAHRPTPPASQHQVLRARTRRQDASARVCLEWNGRELRDIVGMLRRCYRDRPEMECKSTWGRDGYSSFGAIWQVAKGKRTIIEVDHNWAF